MSEKTASRAAITPLTKTSKVTFRNWRFAKRQLLMNTFPIDKETRNYVRTTLNVLFAEVYPVPLKTPVKLAGYSEDVLSELLDLEASETIADAYFLHVVSGLTFVEGSALLSHRYGGHQFGHWSDQLGDGRAVLLGEYVNTKGRRWELQLKGSGQTPYSRLGDGRAVIRSSVREFLASEAMYHLGIPTSRAATLVVSEDRILRDQFYDGHPQEERAAVVLRLAPSWFRIGSLEILTIHQEIDLLKNLTDFVVRQSFPGIVSDNDEKYLAFFSEVVSQTADMIAKWMSVGFTHGVCNTDNFSLLSITIDYGPFGFLNQYIPGYVPNTSDDEQRYSYEKQPDVGFFNLGKLKQALLPLVHTKNMGQMDVILKGYYQMYKNKFMKIFREKLGFRNRGHHSDYDEALIALLLKIMEDKEADFTMTFRNLAEIPLQDLTSLIIHDTFWALKEVANHRLFPQFVQFYAKRLFELNIADHTRQSVMRSINPRYILRNWMAQAAIEKAEHDDFKTIELISRVLRKPFTKQIEAEHAGYSNKPPDWSKNLKVSCSS